MPKILLFRAARDLSARLVSELARAGYDVAAPESADVRTVLQHQPDLILLPSWLDSLVRISPFPYHALQRWSKLQKLRKRCADVEQSP